MNRRRKNVRNGFTLIELVASALLTSILMAAVLSVVWSALRESTQLQRDATNRFPVSGLVSQMRIDFQNARGMAIDSDGVTLHGFLFRDATSQPQWLPGRVRYSLRDVAGRRVLLRSDQGMLNEPVWIGLGGLRIDPLIDADPDNDLMPEPETGELPTVPLSFRLTMVGDRGQVLWQEVIHHHEG